MRKIILFSLLCIGIGSNATATEMECEVLIAKQKWIWEGEELLLSVNGQPAEKYYPSEVSGVKSDIQTSDGLPVFEVLDAKGYKLIVSFIDKMVTITSTEDAFFPINGTFPCK